MCVCVCERQKPISYSTAQLRHRPMDPPITHPSNPANSPTNLTNQPSNQTDSYGGSTPACHSVSFLLPMPSSFASPCLHVSCTFRQTGVDYTTIPLAMFATLHIQTSVRTSSLTLAPSVSQVRSGRTPPLVTRPTTHRAGSLLYVADFSLSQLSAGRGTARIARHLVAEVVTQALSAS